MIDNGKDRPSFRRIPTFEKFFTGLAKCLEDIYGTLVQKHFFFQGECHFKRGNKMGNKAEKNISNTK